MDPSIQTLAQTLLKDSIDANSLDSADIAPTQSSQAGMSVPLSTLSTSSKQQQQQQPTNTLASSKVRMNPHQQGLHQQQQPSAKQSNTSTPQSMKQANTQPSTQTTMTGNGVYLCITGCRGSGKAATMSKLADINSETQARHHESEHNKNKGSNGSVNANTSNSKPQQPPMNAWVSVDDENEDESWGFTSPSANAQTPSGGANRATPSSLAGTPSGKPPVNTQDFGSADGIKSPPSMRKKGALSARASLVPKESPHGSNSARGGLVPISGSLDNFDDLLSFGVADDAGKFST
jgi:hypothetical protein